jgi:hypothetical protein
MEFPRRLIFEVQTRTDRGQFSLEKLFTTTTGTDSQDGSKRKRLALEGNATHAGNCPWGSTLILAVNLDWGRVRSVHDRLVFLSRFARSCISSVFRWRRSISVVRNPRPLAATRRNSDSLYPHRPGLGVTGVRPPVTPPPWHPPRRRRTQPLSAQAAAIRPSSTSSITSARLCGQC